MDEHAVIKDLKKKRRNIKAALTRQGNALQLLLDGNRSVSEITDQVEKLQLTFDKLVEKHECYTVHIDDDEDFDKEEAWLTNCQQTFIALKCKAADYVKSADDLSSAESAASDPVVPDPVSVTVHAAIDPPSPDVATPNADTPNAAVPDDTVTSDAVVASPVTCTPVSASEVVMPVAGNSEKPKAATPNVKPDSADGATTCSFKMEKPKLPKFGGDVREYFTFRADFRYMIDSRYSKRDAIALLRTCLQGKPLDMIKGLGCDYDAAWDYLNAIYGDPRFIADIITQDIVKFKPLKNDEDTRFCELVHLVKKSHNILKEVGRPHDMDNNHMLAMIEKKMNADDRKVWFRFLEGREQEASLENLMSWMNAEMKSRMRATAPVRNQSNAHVSTVNHIKTVEKKTYPSFKCWICQSADHWVDQCPRLSSMTPIERQKLMKDNHACYSCMKKAGRTHNMSTCSRRRQCREIINGIPCKMCHHPLLHVHPGLIGHSRPIATGSVGVASVNNGDAILPIVEVEVLGCQSASLKGNLLLDSGAQISLITTSLARRLNLQGKDITVAIHKVGGEEEELRTQIFRVHVRPLNKPQVHAIQAIAIPRITEEVTEVQLLEISQHFKIPCSELHREKGPVDLLVGIDHPKLHIGETREAGNLVARHSPLGWVIFGMTSRGHAQKTHVLHVSLSSPVDLTDFWTTESMGVTGKACTCLPQKRSVADIEESAVIEKSCRKIGNRWMIPYPWKKEPDSLPDNRSQVEKKLQSIERRLQRDPSLAESYDHQIMEMCDLGHARKLSSDEVRNYEGPVHYIAHHAVVRPEKKSTPVRIVFNSSASYHGHQLNDYWMKGPDLLNSLFGVILRFRENEVAVSGDISKMYHQILIPERDQQVHRFLWRSMKTDQKPSVFVKTVLTFGDKPAPAMAQIALRKTAEEVEITYPEAAKVLKENVYMDDICTSTCTEAEAQMLMNHLDDALAQGGFKVKGWLTNKLKDDEVKSQDRPQMRLLDNLNEEKVLGTVWNPEDDIMSYKVNTEVQKYIPTNGQEENRTKLTKRRVLSQIARIFDPIGFASALLIRVKIGMQRLWQLGLEWDEELPLTDEKPWISLFKEIQRLNIVSFDRSLTPPDAVGSPMLCIFSDASEDAFGACAYLRWSLSHGSYGVRFVAAKSRVAPLKRLTVPRLELQAAVTAARLYKTIMEETRLQFAKTVFFCDSTIVLAWIRSSSKALKPFVANRVAEIQDATDPIQWKHIPGEVNVADDVSRGIAVEQLLDRWKHGPDFLYSDEADWPQSKSQVDLNEMKREERKTQSVLVIAVKEDLIDCSRFSSWRKLVRVTAFVQRYIWNSRHRKDSQEKRRSGPLSSQELTDAQTYWIRQAQQSLHKRLSNGEFKSLTPYIDGDGLIRVGGRVDMSMVSYPTKHPALLPYNHYMSLIITRQMHEVGHSGIAATVARIRNKYWILKAHKLAKKVKYRCVPCRKTEHKTETQLMGNLPSYRLAPFSPPFHYTACDYFGPYLVKVGRNKTTKHYGVIFTCLNTRAVHLELAVDCSTMEFLQVLRRFFAVRGLPSKLISDNGTQFIGAERELREMIRGWDKSALRQFCAERQMEWTFVTPSAPHQNGCAESLVKTCKSALKQAIGAQVLTPFELYTALQEVANLVNQRPIGRIPNDPDDGKYLCPNDILLGRSSTEVPQGPFQETKNPRRRVEFVQRIVDSFWRRWHRDVFPGLVPRKKWRSEVRNIQIDDVVMMSEANALRGKWHVGRVVDVYPGPDGRVRNVKVKTSDGEYRRPVTKVAVLYPNGGYEDDDKPVIGAEDVPASAQKT